MLSRIVSNIGRTDARRDLLYPDDGFRFHGSNLARDQHDVDRRWIYDRSDDLQCCQLA